MPGEILDMSEHWLTATIELGAIYVRQATVESKDTADAFSKQAYPSIPLQNCLFTPELQWQSRGQMAYLTGVPTHLRAQRGAILQHATQRVRILQPPTPVRSPPRINALSPESTRFSRSIFSRSARSVDLYSRALFGESKLRCCSRWHICLGRMDGVSREAGGISLPAHSRNGPTQKPSRRTPPAHRRRRSPGCSCSRCP